MKEFTIFTCFNLFFNQCRGYKTPNSNSLLYSLFYWYVETDVNVTLEKNDY